MESGIRFLSIPLCGKDRDLCGKDRNVDNIANIRWYAAWGLNDNEQAREEEDIRLKRGQWMTSYFRNGRHGVPLSLTSYGSAQRQPAA